MMRLILILTLSLLTITLARAQESTLEPADGWTIEQRCVGEPVIRPTGWTFDGTILMTGYAGIHGVNDEWETPHVLIFLGNSNMVPASSSRYSLGWYGDGALSPNDQWYVVVEGETIQCYTGMCGEIRIHALNIYSTSRMDEVYRIDWDYTYGYGSQGLFQPIFWYDNSHLLFKSDTTAQTETGYTDFWLINPFTGEQTPWQEPLDPGCIGLQPSPDWTRGVCDADSSRGTEIVFLDDENRTPISLRYTGIAWRSDSLGFAASLNIGTDGASQLALLDRDANVMEVISQNPANFYVQLGSWSPDNRYFTFTAPSLHIVDTQEHNIVNTCISTGVAYTWAENSNQIAFITSPSNQDAVVRIIDLENWQQYSVARHRGFTLGWRADD